MIVIVIADNIKLPNCTHIVTNMRTSPDWPKFCDYIMKQAFGVIKWRERVVEKELQDFVKPSFEAFCLLCYENCYDSYMEKEEQERNAEAAAAAASNIYKRKKFKYTSESRVAARNKGWPKKAIERYNELHDRVKRDRRENFDWDVQYKMIKLEEIRSKKKKVARDEGADEAIDDAAHDIVDNIDWNEI